MIDTTDPKAVELALTYCQGKSIINSVNLEDGEEKFERLCPIAKRFGAALVVGSIDEDKLQAQAFTRERKLAVAQRSVQLLTGEVRHPGRGHHHRSAGVPLRHRRRQLYRRRGRDHRRHTAGQGEDPVRQDRAGDLQHHASACRPRRAKWSTPSSSTTAPRRGSIWRSSTRKSWSASLRCPKKSGAWPSTCCSTRRRPTPKTNRCAPRPRTGAQQTAEQKAAINQFHIAAIAEHFRETGARVKQHAEDLPLDQRLANYIIEGTKDGLIADLDLKRAEGATPLEIINGPLMAGMSEVGRLFNNNELIVAEVLQSAEAMKAAVNHLEQFMEKADTAARGKVILATVKGDVHDIGKNLVEIILANNGYDVVNLGIKVPPDVLIQACMEHQPDAIGLSGLLVKSTQQMVITATDLKAAGILAPMLVGGAALSEKIHAHQDRAGLRRGGLLRQGRDDRTEPDESPDGPGGARRRAGQPTRSPKLRPRWKRAPSRSAPMTTRRSRKVRTDLPIPPAPYLDRRVRDVPNLAEVWSYINPFMIYGRHLGYKGNFEKALAEHEEKALELFHNVEEVKHEAARFMKVKAVWQFFEAERDGNAIHLFAPGGRDAHSHLPLRPPAPRRRTLPERLHPGRRGRQARSSGAMVVTAGAGIREKSEEWKKAGAFFKAHAIQALAIETAEATAEWLHRRIREDWGFPDAPTVTMHDRFTSKYHGKRYSFGYPACPNLDDQQGVWKLLSPRISACI